MTEVYTRIPGAIELKNWFGSFPRFHDAEVREFQLRGDGSGSLRVHGWQLTDKVDERGYFVTEKHFEATFLFEGMSLANLSDFMPGMAIIYGLDIRDSGAEFEVVVETSYGFCGTLRMSKLTVTFRAIQE